MWDVATDPTACAGGHHPDGRLPATPGPRESSQPSFGESHKNAMDANSLEGRVMIEDTDNEKTAAEPWTGNPDKGIVIFKV
jgi:hypothetical protein